MSASAATFQIKYPKNDNNKTKTMLTHQPDVCLHKARHLRVCKHLCDPANLSPPAQMLGVAETQPETEKGGEEEQKGEGREGDVCQMIKKLKGFLCRGNI